jgi:hypothetical protein
METDAGFLEPAKTQRNRTRPPRYPTASKKGEDGFSETALHAELKVDGS